MRKRLWRSQSSQFAWQISQLPLVGPPERSVGIIINQEMYAQKSKIITYAWSHSLELRLTPAV